MRLFKMPKDKMSVSIKQRLVAGVLAIVFLQLAITLVAISASKVVGNLRNSVYDLFLQTVTSRLGSIENEMHERWSAITDFVPQLAEFYPETISEGERPSENQVQSYFADCYTGLVSMLRDTAASGAFIILDDSTGEGKANSCFYLSDSDPTHNDLRNDTDLSILKGPIELVETLKVPLHIKWNYGVTLDDTNRDILTRPVKAAYLTKSYQHLGYWGVVPSFTDTAATNITYTMPLISENNVVFGVVGIEVSQEYFFRTFSAQEIPGSGTVAYAILEKGEDAKLYPAMTRGSAMRVVIPEGNPVKFEGVGGKYDGVRIDGYDPHMAAAYKSIKLYDVNTPYSNDEWYLLGITAESTILSSSKSLLQSLLIAIAVAVVLCVALAIGIAAWFAAPVEGLAKRIKAIVPGEKVDLGKTSIIEMNALASAIEQLADDVFNSAAKTEKIISMVNLEIGSFDYRQGDDQVEVSSGLIHMLSLPIIDIRRPYVDKAEFVQMLTSIRSHPIGDNTFRYSESPPKWLKLESVETDGREFGVAVDVTRDELKRQAIMFERDYDVLTGIYNRYAFHREFGKIIASGDVKLGAFIMGDLDNLKYLNDTYGHDTGDSYIRATAGVISKYFKGNSNVTYGRMSGDEFYIFMYNYPSQDEIRGVIYDFYIHLNEAYIQLPDGGRSSLKMSSGVSWYPLDTTNTEDLVRFADFAMYKGKHSVKGGIREFDQAVYSSDSYMMTGKEELYRILDEQLIDYMFQPIVRLTDGSIYGYEALMRPQGKSVNTPDKLLNLAQAQAQLWKVEKNTFYMTLELCKKYHTIFDGAKLFINSVPNQVLKESEYDELEYLYGDILSDIVVEITESESVENFSLMRKKELVNKWNALLALDDYGSGYANDMMLVSMRPNIIKVDQFLINGIEHDTDKHGIVEKTIAFAKERGIVTLAEGVETYRQLEMVKRMGFNLVQGYYISRPMTKPDFNSEKIVHEIQCIG